MSVDKATVAKIASLARIAMDDAALERMVPELNGILAWVEQLGEVDVTGIEPMTAVIPNHLRLRDDVVDADPLTGGGKRDAVQIWLGRANQTAYASLARFVVMHGESDPVARAILEHAGREVASIAHALDPEDRLPLALCGGLGEVLLAWLPPETRARCLPPRGDSAQGALRMIELHIKKKALQ